MTKCLFKALKAVDLDQRVGLFRSLGYDSAGALAYFRAEHFESLNFNEEELLRFIALLDVLKEATHEGKVCPHYFNSNKTNKQQSKIKSAPIQANWSDETTRPRNSQSTVKKQSTENFQNKNSMGFTGRLSSASMATTNIVKNHSNEFNLQRPSTVLSRQHPITPKKANHQRNSKQRSFLSRPAVQHIKVKSYNYGVPSKNSPRNKSHRQHGSHMHHGSIFVYRTNDTISSAKAAEIYVYARKRPLLSSENNFQDMITVPDNKRIIISENKANLDCTPLLKKTEFEFDQVFGSDVSNKQVFESTVLPFISSNHRHNLTYICFGQTGSGKSHTIFGNPNNDGLLAYCTQLLLQESNCENQLICSFYEIYNNQAYDLINAGKRLFVREDGEHHVNVIGVTEMILRNLDNLRCIIDSGLTRRHHGRSAFNSNSSRSHSIFQIILKNNYDSSNDLRLKFIDLAGSERATDAQNNQRQTRREGAQINWSLLALKECIRSMDMTHSHAPFRQSKLTHILRDSLIGLNARTCLMANVSPPDDCCQCSLNTLQYASRIRSISIRHRHRTMPMTNIPINSMDDNIKEQEIVPEKTQRTFKPATASTPVHRLISSADQRIHMLINQKDIDICKTKPMNIDWQIVDDDIPITGSGDNRPAKSVRPSTNEFSRSLNNKKNQMQKNKHYINSFQQQKILNDIDQSPSNYFPQPQANIRKSLPIKTKEIKHSYDTARLMYDDGNERHWNNVAAPTISHHSNLSVDPTNVTKSIPIVPTQILDENPYCSTIGTGSFRSRIKQVAVRTQRNHKNTKQNEFVENLNLNPQYNLSTMTTVNTEQILDSDRLTTKRDQSEFFTNRDELLSIVSNRLTNISRRSSSVKSNKKDSRSGRLHSKNSSSLSSKNRHKTRSVKSASSTSSAASINQERKYSLDNKKSKSASSNNVDKSHPTTQTSSNRHQQQMRTVPFRAWRSSELEENEKINRDIHSQKITTHAIYEETCRTNTNIGLMKNQSEKTDDYCFPEHKHPSDNTEQSLLTLAPTSSPLSTSLPSTTFVPTISTTQVPLDQVTLAFNQSVEQPLSSPNIKNPWPVPPSYTFNSPSKDFGARVSDQLHALRALLEKCPTDQNETNQKRQDSSILQSTPNTFSRQAFQSPLKNNSNEFLVNIHNDDKDDDDDREVERNFNSISNTKNDKMRQYEGDILSTTIMTTTSTTATSSNQHEYLSIHDELNQAKVISSVTSSSTSTITSNLAAKIDTQEIRNLLSQNDDIHSEQSFNPSYHAENETKSIRENGTYPTSDSERTSQINSTVQNPYTGTSSSGSISNESRSPVLVVPLTGTSDRTNMDDDHLLNNGIGSSILTGTSFDALLNSLKNIRENDFNFVVRTRDDKFLPVAD